MSEKAGGFYAGVAAAHDFSPLPQVLDGVPIYLLQPDQELSINSALQHPDSAECIELRCKYDEIIQSLSPFLLACAGIVKKETSEARARANYNLHLSGMIERWLIPKDVKTGRLTKIRIQAVTPDEVNVRKLMSTVPGTKTAEKRFAVRNSVLLVTMAGISTGYISSARYVGYLTTVNRSPASPGTCIGIQLTGRNLAVIAQSGNGVRAQ